MQGKEFRCHPSIIVANSFKVIIISFIAMFSSISEESFAEGEALDINSAAFSALITAGIVFLIMIIYLTTRFFAWRRTYISITDENFVYDKRTVFFQKKVNVRLAQISTVNLQKGIIDRIFGTYTVKLDINSSATAEKNDFHLVFKEEFAKEFEATILSIKENENTKSENAEAKKTFDNLKTIIKFDTGRIILHSLFMTPVWSTIVFGAALAGVSVPFMELSPVFYPVAFLLGLPVALIASFVASLIRNVFLYHDFTLSKSHNELVVSFGLITKRIYKLPLSKTNAVVVRQSFFGRIFGMYYAEIINVGMGNEEDKLSPVFCLMLKKDALEQILNSSVPAFSGEIKVEASPNKAFLPTFLKGIVPMVVLFCSAVIFGLIFESTDFVLLMSALLLLVWVILAVFSYKAKGINIREDRLTVATGILSRRFIIVPFSKVQMLTVKSGPVCKPLGLRSGVVSVLSSQINQNNKIGYFAPEQFKKIEEKIQQYESIDWSI